MEPIQYLVEINYWLLSRIIPSALYESRVSLYLRDNLLLGADYDPSSGKHDETYSFNFAFVHTIGEWHLFVVNTRMDLELIAAAARRFIAVLKLPPSAGTPPQSGPIPRIMIFKRVYNA